MKKLAIYILAAFFITIQCRAEEAVGTISGTLGINETGAATYTIPIDLLSSPYGEVPSIALTYNSQAGNGPVGVGWGISGLSSISITPRNIYFDGAAEGLHEGADNAYYLDGMRLLLVSGENGHLGATYRTEKENYSLITIDSVLNETPAMFTVKTTDGSIYKYGSHTGRMYYSNNACYAWALDYAEDRLGNYTVYEYAQNGMLYPTSITYGRNKHNSASLPYTISFSYSSRPDKIPLHCFEQNTLFNQLLYQISCACSNNVYRTYNLTYETHTFSYLTSVRETGVSSSHYPETTFVWEHLPGYDIEAASSTVAATYLKSFTDMYFFAGDVDNNGKCELMGLFDYTLIDNPYIGMKVWSKNAGNGNFSSSDLYSTQEGISIPGMYQGLYQGGTLAHASHRSDNSIVLPYYSNLYGNRHMNFNFLKEGRTLHYPLRSSATNACYIISDIDNDAMDDIVMIEQAKLSGTYPATLIHINAGNGSMTYTEFSMNLAGKPTRIVAADMNRDGMADLIISTTNGFYIYWNNAGSFSDNNRYHGSAFSECDVMELGDVNADGLPDLIINKHNSTTWLCAVNQGNRTTPYVFYHISILESLGASTNSRKNEAYCLVQDFNGDGKSDLLVGMSFHDSDEHFQSAQMVVLKSLGASFQLLDDTSFPTQATFPSRTKIVQGDFDGDGIPEIMYYGGAFHSSSTDVAWRTLKLDGFSAATNHITSVTDGLGTVRRIGYGLLTDSEVCESTDASTFPLLTMRAPVPVVRRIETIVGSDTLWSNYKYANALFHWQGKGFLGFKERTTTSSTGTKSVLRDSINGDYYVLYPVSEKVYASDNSLWKDNKFRNYFVSAGPKSYSVLSTFNRSDDVPNGYYDISGQGYSHYGVCDGVDHHDESFTTNTEYTFWESANPDLYVKNLPAVIETEKSGGSLYMEESERTEYTRDNNGFPLSCRKYRNGTLLETELFSYNACGQLTSHTVIHGNSTDSLTTTYTYFANGRLRYVTNPLGRKEYYSYNARGMLHTKRDFLGYSTVYSYDGMLRKVASSNPMSGMRKTYALSDYGNSVYKITEEKDGEPAHTVFYDGLGRKVAEAEQRFDGRWLYTDYAYNSMGELSFTSFPHTTATPSSDGTSNTFDVFHRLTSQTDSQGKTSTWSYRPMEVTSTIDGVTRTTEYSHRDIVIEVEDESGYVFYETDAGGRIVEIGHNSMDATIDYDDYGRTTQTVDLQGTTRAYAYDANGHPQSVTQGTSVRYTNYDKYGRLISQTFHDDGQTDTQTYYRYDDRSLLVCDSSSNHRYSYEYDGGGRVVREERKIYHGGTEQTIDISYSYNSLGQLASKSSYIPEVGLLTESYTYNNGWCTAISLNNTLVWQLDEEDNMGHTRVVHSPLDSLTRSFDVYGHLLSQRSARHPQANQTYAYDITTGNVTSWKSTQCQYDSFNRLTRWGNYFNYGYDDEGNLTTIPHVSNIQYNGFKMSSITATTYQPMMEQYGRQTFSYLRSIERPLQLRDVNHAVQFAYDGDRRRVWMEICNVSNGSSTTPSLSVIGARYYVSENYEIDQIWTSYKRHFYYVGGTPYDAPAVLVAENGSSQIYQIYRDNLGSIVMYAGAGDSTKVFTYTPWGQRYKRVQSANPIWGYPADDDETKFFRFYTGHEELPYFHLLNANARIYDPNLGRFLSPDPIFAMSGGPLDMNPYVYGRNNPLSYVDPDGEIPLLLLAAAAFIGGTTNVIFNWENIKGFSSALSYFAMGSAASALTMFAGPLAGAAVLGAGNSILTQGFQNGWKHINWAEVGFSSGLSMATSAVGGWLGNKFSAPISKLTSNISNDVVRESLNGALVNSATGFVLGSSFSLATGNDFKTSLRNGGYQAGGGLIIGGTYGLGKGLYMERQSISINPVVRIDKNSVEYKELLKAAQERYPNKAGKIEKHHIVPKYLGGDPNGELIEIDAAYHQMITNAFRNEWHYGKGYIKNEMQMRTILQNVYMKYPLPE